MRSKGLGSLLMLGMGLLLASVVMAEERRSGSNAHWMACQQHLRLEAEAGDSKSTSLSPPLSGQIFSLRLGSQKEVSALRLRLQQMRPTSQSSNSVAFLRTVVLDGNPSQDLLLQASGTLKELFRIWKGTGYESPVPEMEIWNYYGLVYAENTSDLGFVHAFGSSVDEGPKPGSLRVFESLKIQPSHGENKEDVVFELRFAVQGDRSLALRTRVYDPLRDLENY